ncbi:MAG: NAD(P)/FAD-dependent oxidoreductase [Planctomycetota bacterium]|nr:NAD(P)/FAD-dependent oxidoreductase [Planctomycetota bacterium]MDA1211158.1 NAD(P)/FAD-dependent oxidoreductase [Planctomycetota bacterium]
MQSYDTVIVGGGPAGSTCADHLRAAGLDVLLIDQREFPRDKTCAGWITPPIVETLNLNIEEYSQHAVCQPITAFRTGMIGGKAVETDYGRIVSYGIRRCEFDDYLLKRSGVPTQLGHAVKSLEYRDAQWEINGEIRTPLLIGAGGHFCPVARQLGAKSEESATVVAAQEIEFEMSDDDIGRCNVQPHQPELYFCSDLAGYGWCFRKRNFLNIGLGRTNGEKVSHHVDAFADFLKQTGRYTGRFPGKFHGHAYRLYEREFPQLFGDGVLLIGDAAGLAYPQSGEGIRPAVESAVLAAETIIAANKSYGRDQLAPYRDRLVARLGTPRNTDGNHWLPQSWLCTLAGTLLGTKWFTKHVVLDRWFLHANTAALKSNHERHEKHERKVI